MLIVPLLVLTPLYLRLERRPPAAPPARRCCSASCSSSRSRPCRAAACSGSASARSSSLLPYRGYLRSRALIAPLLGRARRARRRHRRRGSTSSSVVIRSRIQTGGDSESAHFQVYSFIPQILHSHPLLRARAEQLLDLLPGDHRQDELGAALLLRLADRRDRDRRDGARSRCFLVWAFVRLAVARRLGAALALARQSARGAGDAARLGLDGRARRDARGERLLPDDAVLLLLRLPRARPCRAARLRPGAHAEPEPEDGQRAAATRRLRRGPGRAGDALPEPGPA